MIDLADILDKTPAFYEFMADLDRELVSDSVPVPGRPLAALQKIAVGLKREIIFAGAQEDPISQIVSEWFDHRYGDRLKIDLSPGRVVVFVRGDPLVMRLPLIVGRWDGILDVTKLFEGLTQPLFAAMSEAEMQDLIAVFPWFRDRFDRIDTLPQTVRANIDTAIRQMTVLSPHFGESKWASLQFAEKSLKYFIRERQAQPPPTHDLSKLLAIAERLGLFPGRWPLLKMIQCKASARYDGGVSLNDAVLAHHASIDLAAFVAEQLRETTARKELAQMRSELPDLVLSFEYGVETTHDGGLLFSLAMANGALRRLLLGSCHCLWLQDVLGRSVSEGRHPDVRQQFANGHDIRSAPPRHPLRMFDVHQPSFGPSDYQQHCHQVASMRAYDEARCVVIEMEFADGSTGRSIIFSELIPLFLEAISSGVEEGRTKGLFSG